MGCRRQREFWILKMDPTLLYRFMIGDEVVYMHSNWTKQRGRIIASRKPSNTFTLYTVLLDDGRRLEAGQGDMILASDDPGIFSEKYKLFKFLLSFVKYH